MSKNHQRKPKVLKATIVEETKSPEYRYVEATGARSRDSTKLNISPMCVKKCALFLTMLLLVTTFPTPQVYAENDATWIPFIPGAEPGTLSQVLPKSKDTTGFCVDSNFYGMYSLTTYINDTRYNVLQVPSVGHATVVGKPAVPMCTRYLEIPENIKASIQILYKDMKILDGFNVIPAQEQPEDFINATEPSFVIDQTTYTTNAFYPSEIAYLDGANGLDPIVIRGHRIVPLNLFPVQFNPVTQQVRVYSKIEVRLNYDEPAQIGPLDARLISPDFETLLKGLVINYEQRTPLIKKEYQAFLWSPTKYESTLSQKGPEIHFMSDSPNEVDYGVDYLIITHDTFYNQVQKLAAWKEQKGLKTRIVNTSQIAVAGPTADDIAAYIKNAYETWYPAPSYVLLVGDSDFIPPHYRTPHPSPSHGGGLYDIPTDLYYATVDGADYFPDIYVGRLSVDTTAQTTTIVDKILDYERNPPVNAVFYDNVAVCAQFQDERHPECGVWHNADGFEDRRFVLTSEEIRDFLLTQGYTVERIYWAFPGNPFAVPPIPAVNPTNYSICAFDNGDPIPANLLRANGFQWNGAAIDITNNINAGRFILYHRDHGSSRNFWDHDNLNFANVDGWTHPDYDVGDIGALFNAPLLPVVFSIECQCGWFDGEVDQNNDGNLTLNFESFCEEFVRQPNGGAIAAIGATRNSRSGYNDQMVRGFIDAIWPEFDLSFESGGLYKLGQILTYGKVYMATQYGYTGGFTNETFNLFHIFGDPELDVWTEQPREFNVSHPTDIGSMGIQSFVVNVTDHDTGAPIHYAKVCLQKDTEVYSVAYTDPGGGAYFKVYPTSGGEMNITVTKHNFEPYDGVITVTDGGATLTINPDSGPQGINPTLQGNNFNDGETVEIYFGGILPDKTVIATGGTFTETATVPIGPVGPINVRAVGLTSGKTAVTIFRRLPDQLLPDPYTYCQWDQSTWTLNPSGGDPRWNNPKIVLYEAATMNQVASNDLIVHKTYVVRADIHNNGTVSAVDTEVTFEWGDWGAGQRVWNKFGNDTITVPALGVATAETNWTPSLTGHTCLMISIYHALDENLDNNKGQENTDVHPVLSPGKINFTVGNPTQETALVFLDAKQIEGPDLWAARIEREFPQVQEPGEVLNGTLVVEAPEDTEAGQMRIFTVSGYIDGELIGGVEIIVVVKIPTTISCSISPSKVSLGDPVIVSGSISPAVEGATIILAFDDPEGSTMERVITTDSEGSYNDSYQPDAIGSWSVTAYWRGDATHDESFSSTRSFDVEARKPCQIILAIVIALIALILYLIRNRNREVRILGLIIILIALLLYYWYCIGWSL